MLLGYFEKSVPYFTAKPTHCMYTLSGSSSTSKETFCMVDQPNPGDIQPSFSISGWLLKTLPGYSSTYNRYLFY